MSRRDFVRAAAVASAAAPAFAQGQTPATPAGQGRGGARGGGGGNAVPDPWKTKETLHPVPVRVGMTDWNLGGSGDIKRVALAREIGLDGIQVSVDYQSEGKGPTLRDRAHQQAYRDAALLNGVHICSLRTANMGETRRPIYGNPAAAILLAEAVEIAHNIGTNDILDPVLGGIDMANKPLVDNFVAMMKEVGGYGAKYGVYISLEISMGAEDINRLLDAIGTEYVSVYYDAANIVGRVPDIYAEPKKLGKRIHQIHIKNGPILLETPGGKMDWAKMAKEYYDIGYRGWHVLETSAPSGDLVADTRKNIAYVKKTFRIPPVT